MSVLLHPVRKLLSFEVRHHATGAPPDPSAVRRVVDAWLDDHVVCDALRERLPSIRGELEVRFGAPGQLELLTERSASLGIEERAALDRSNRSATVSITSGPAPDRAPYWLVLGAARALARHLGGIVIDGQTLAAHPLDSCLEPVGGELPRGASGRLGLLSAGTHDGSAWITTLGLAYLGLPELCIDRLSEHRVGAGAMALRWIARHLEAELVRVGGRPLPVHTVAVGTVDAGAEPLLVELSSAVDEAGGAYVRVHPPGDPDGDLDPVLEALERVGLSPEVGRLVEGGRAGVALVREVERLRDELDAVRDRFAAGFAPGERLRLLVFSGPGLATLGWMTPRKWTRHYLRGRSEEGAPVRADASAVVGWRLEHADGTVEGSDLISSARAAAARSEEAPSEQAIDDWLERGAVPPAAG